MDLEPGRCRRTDGKKWRCRLTVLPDQKYCERHIHRGCLRSRKHVEVHKTFSMSNSTTTSSMSSPKAIPAKSNARNHNKVCIKTQSFKFKNHSTEKAHAPLGFSFPAKTVLRHGNVRGCNTSSNDHSSALAGAESPRCRRTDGKKWRCSKDALPEQKYCGQHMHRGAKKVENGQKLNTCLSFSVGVSYKQMGNDGNCSDDSSSSSKDGESHQNGASSSEATTISM